MRGADSKQLPGIGLGGNSGVCGSDKGTDGPSIAYIPEIKGFEQQNR